MSGNIEFFCKNYQYTILMLGSISTLFSVVVALYLASRTNKIKIYLEAELSSLVAMDMVRKGTESWIGLSVVNKSLFPVKLRQFCFFIKFPFLSEGGYIRPNDSFNQEIGSFIDEKKYPVILDSNQCITIYLRKEDIFKENLKEYSKKSFERFNCLNNKIKNVFCRFVMINNINFYLKTDDGTCKRVACDKKLKENLVSLLRKEMDE